MRRYGGGPAYPSMRGEAAPNVALDGVACAARIATEATAGDSTELVAANAATGAGAQQGRCEPQEEI